MLTCMNCKVPVEQKEGQVFAAVFVCPKCFLIAERMYERSERELKGLLVMLRESIRIALLRGELTFAEGRPMEDVPKAEVMQMVMALSAKREAQKTT